MPVIAVVLAAGFGTRFDPNDPKQLVQLAGRPVLAWSLEAFEDCPDVTDIVVVVNPRVFEAVDKLADDMGCRKVKALVPGGETRADSTMAALSFLVENGVPQQAKLLIHDGVRPFVSPKTVEDCVRALDTSNAATVAVPSTDTILLAAPAVGSADQSEPEEGADPSEQPTQSGVPVVQAVPDRAMTYRAQTPQCFRLGTLRRAYELAAGDEGFHPTDDTRVVVDYLPDEPVTVVMGSDDNMKITTRADIDVAETIAPRARRIRLMARRRLAQQIANPGAAGEQSESSEE